MQAKMTRTQSGTGSQICRSWASRLHRFHPPKKILNETKEDPLTGVSRRHFLAVSTGAASLAAGWIQSAEAQARISLRVSSSMSTNKFAAHFAWFEQFQMRLKDTLGDRIELNYFPNGQLGSESDVVEQVKVGSIDMMIAGSSIWATVSPELGMLRQPHHGLPVAFALAFASLLYFVFEPSMVMLVYSQQVMAGSDSFVLLAISFFVLVRQAGEPRRGV